MPKPLTAVRDRQQGEDVFCQFRAREGRDPRFPRRREGDDSRSKGLGENDPDMMWMTTMNPATRRLIKVMPEDAERMASVFELLLGDDLSGRKDHIAEFGSQYLDLADIS